MQHPGKNRPRIILLPLVILLPTLVLAAAVSAGAAGDELTVHLLLQSRRDGFHLQAEGSAWVRQDTLSVSLGRNPDLEILHIPGSGRLLLFKGGELFFSGAEFQLQCRGSFRLAGLADPVGSDKGLRLFVQDGTAHCVLRINLPDYLAGVLQGEMGEHAPLEALKAQAVASRTYVLQKMAVRGIGAASHVPADARAQVYRAGTIPRRIRHAVEETRGQIIARQGRPIDAVYSACCGGVTENAADAFGGSTDPALIAQRDHLFLPSFTPDAARNLELTRDSCCRDTSRFRWRREFTAEELAERLGTDRPVDGLTINEQTGSGRMLRATVTAGSRILRFQGRELRQRLDLPSTLCYLEHERGGLSFVFHGGGYGHGVGLCQAGAIARAREGKRAEEILKFYYPGTEIIQVF